MAAYDTNDVTKPITIAAGILTNPAAGVIATSPATIPVAAPNIVTLPNRRYSISIHASMAAAAEVLVTINADPASCPAASADPALKPNHPNQSKPAPMMAYPVGEVINVDPCDPSTAG